MVRQTEASRPIDLLTVRPLIESTDRDHMASELRRTYGVPTVRFERTDGPFYALANRVQLDGVTLHYCRYDAPSEIAFADMPGYRQLFCLSGQGRVRTRGEELDISRSASAIIPPRSDFTANYAAGYQHLVVQFDEQALLHKAERLTGRAVKGLDALPVVQPRGPQRTWRTRSIGLSLAEQFSEELAFDSLVVVEMVQALTSAFLLESLPGLDAATGQGGGLAGRRDANRLEDYLHAHWNQPLTVESVAEACGVSVRSVFARFQQQRGMTPMAYLRDLRLDSAHRLLLESEGPQSVLDIAMACGFSSFGHFARRYREKFGELPSATILRRRRMS